MKIKESNFVKFEKDEGSDTLIILFSGADRKGIGRYHFEWSNFMKNHKIPGNKLYLCDKVYAMGPKGIEYMWFTNGITDISSDIDSTIEFLKQVIDEYQIKKIMTVGWSMGGYAAMLYGSLLKVNMILSFNPQTFLWLESDPDILKDYILYDTTKKIKNRIKESDHYCLNLKNVISKDCKYLYVHSKWNIDKYHASNLSEFSNITFIETNSEVHNSGPNMKETGQLLEVWKDALEHLLTE